MLCEFCGRRHSDDDDLCPLSKPGYEDSNVLDEGGYQVRLEDIFKQVKSSRELKLEVMIPSSSNAVFQGLALNPVSPRASFDGKSVSLASCFTGFSKEEKLSGNDQWYCSKCKEHRDIFKKLQIYKVPKILMI